MRWQDPHRRPYASSRGCCQDSEAHRCAPFESPAQLLAQPIPTMPGLEFLAKTALSVSMNAAISVPRALSVFSQRDALGERP